MKKSGNPNWGEPYLQPDVVKPTLFEETVSKLGLAPADFNRSLELRDWVRQNKDQRYVPSALLEQWAFDVQESCD